MSTTDHADGQLSLFDMPAWIDDPRAPCIDCGVSTRSPWERYMVKDEVWERAVPEDDPSKFFMFLCVGCLEGRLGRTLTRADFTDASLNAPNRYDSSRLARRKRAL